ncbi:MAG: hypothetical protein FD163_1693 [Hyphomonadaceae bacterium]|nr:MAG: hypothetical protein FD128_1721 [Hyphomonadaceae bacterium]KAF0184996.1 MAG: hypothetical protein FD163_1693 [Hyphomonadaceae bacterium]
MMNSVSKFLPKIVIGAVFAGFAATAALAVDNGGPVDAAIASRIIGEQANGYLGFVRTPTTAQADLQRTINEINIRRRAVYTEVATSQNETVDRVALLQALRQIQKAAIGDYFRDTANVWCAKSATTRSLQAADGTIIISCAAQ